MKRLKPLLCGALCVLLCAVAALPASATAKPRFGDANNDGSVNMKDILVLRSHLAGTAVELNAVYADADASGSINMKDVLLVRKFVAGLPVTFGGEGKPLDRPIGESENVSLSVYDIKPDGEFGYELLVGAENTTTDREIEVTLLGVSVNDVTSMPLWSVTLSPGKGEVAAVAPNFELFGGADGEAVEKIGLLFVALDTKTGEWVDVGKQPCILFTGDETAYKKTDRTPKDGLTLLKNEEIQIVATGISEDPFFGLSTLDLFMENRTDKPLLYVCSGAEIDEKPAEALWLSILLPGTSTHAGMLFQTEGVDLANAKSIRFSVDAYTVESLNEENPFPLHSYNVKYVKP